jgi:uncharacterized protein (DUF983 family)
MNTAIKAFLTYAGISMFAGFVLITTDMADIIPRPPHWLVFVTWMGPMMIVVSILLPVGLWKFWSGK